MIYLSAGHHLKDPGAVGVNKRKEADETMKLRDLVIGHLKSSYPKYKFISDKDSETLGEYLSRIKPGSGSVVLELHFDAFNGKATGSTCLVGDDASSLDNNFAKELVESTSAILKIPNRGVKKESQSARGKLGFMRNQGTVALLEVCFIDNTIDMEHYDMYKNELAKRIADILIKYEDLAS